MGDQAAEDWRRLADYVIRRRSALALTQEDVRGRGGPSTATMRLIEGALQTGYRPVILARLEIALGWAPGSVDAVLAGGEPTIASSQGSQPPPVDERPVDGELAVRILEVLDSGLSKDTQLRFIRAEAEKAMREIRRVMADSDDPEHRLAAG